MSPPVTRLLKLKTVAEQFLDCSVRMVWQLIALGHLESIKLGPHATRVTEESVLRFIASRRKDV